MVKVDYKIPKTLALYMKNIVTNNQAKILEIGVGTGLLGLQVR